MKLNAQVKWKSENSAAQMSKSLEPHNYDREKIIKKFFVAGDDISDGFVETTLRCGTGRARSYFVITKGTGTTSLLQGMNHSHRLDHLLGDFSYLCHQMRDSRIPFNIEEIHLRLNGEKLIKKTWTQYILSRSIVVDLISLTGGSTIMARLFFNRPIEELWMYATMGLILWLVTSVLGYGSEPDFVLQ